MREAIDPMIGERVMLARRRKGITQYDLAAQLGMSKTVLNRLEVGKQTVSAERLRSIARALGATTDYLLGMDEVSHRHESQTPEQDATSPRPKRQRTRQPSTCCSESTG